MLLTICITSWRNVYSSPSPIFELGCLVGCCFWVLGTFYISWILLPYQIYDLSKHYTIPIILWLFKLEHMENVMVVTISKNGRSTLIQSQFSLPVKVPNPSLQLLQCQSRDLLWYSQNCGNLSHIFFQMLSVKGSTKSSWWNCNLSWQLVRDALRGEWLLESHSDS